MRRVVASIGRWLRGQRYLVKLTLALTGLVLLVAAMGYLITAQTTGLIAAESQNELEQSSLVQAQNLDTWLGTMERETSRLAGSGVVQSGNTTAINTYLNDTRAELPRAIRSVHYVEFRDRTAIIEATTEGGLAGRQLDTESTPFLNRSTLSSERVSVSDPYERELGGQMIAFQATVPENETRAVVLVVDPGTAAQGLRAPPDGQTFAVNDQGTIVISTRPETIGDSAFERGYLTPRTFEQARDTPPGLFATSYNATISYGGDQQLTGMTRLSNRDWVTVAQTPASIAFQVRNQVRSLLGLLVGGVVLASVGIVGIFGYTTVRDITNLSAKAREVEQGNYEVELATDRRDEIGDAYRSVEGMRDALAEQIRESALVEHSNALISVIDPDGTITYQSPSAKHIVGFDPDTMEGQNIFEITHHDDDEAVMDAVQHAVEEPETEQRFQFRVQNAAGEWRFFQGVCENFLDDPFVEGLIISSRDITDIIRRERQLEETKAKLEQSNEKLEQFAYVASHDLQEPLRMISSYMDLLELELGDDLDEEAQEYMDFAADGAERMQAMIDGLLTYSRVQTDGDPFEEVDSDVVLDNTLQDLALKIDDSGAEIERGTLPTVTADSNQLGQVFQNLIKNAVEHGDENTVVEITATERDGATEFAVADNGPGIPEDRQEDIFAIFDKGGDSEGTGIGLAVCQEVVERHGGEIWVDSTEGEGTTFYFTIAAKPDQ